jgi:hypothetical protein
VPVARALSHAHHEGIVHRDVKPENIFLVQRSQGRWGVKVVDFGIAKTPINPKLTNMNETLGSPLFMAPEMIRGEDDAVDQRTDVYSFGVLLYLMMCGRLPFFDDNLLKVMQMHLSSPVPPPRSVNPALPLALADVVDRALAKHPDDRYASMAALLIEFEAALPHGAERLLIEAQSGTAAHATPFAGAMPMTVTGPRPIARPSSPPPIGVVPLARPSSPPPIAVRPAAPRRSRAAVALAIAAIAAVLIAAGAAYQLAGRSRGASDGGDRSALLTGPAEPVPPAATVPATAAAPVAAATEEPAAAATEEPAAAPAPAVAVAGAALSAVRPGPGRLAPGPRKPALRPPVPRRGAGPHLVADAAPAAADSEPPAAAAPVGDSAPAPAAEPERHAAPLPMPAPAPPPPPPPATPAVAPAVGPQVAAAPAVPRSFDAVPEIASVDLQGSLPASVARRSVERVLPGLRACYASAARAGRAAPAIELRLSFEVDENSVATHVATGDVGFGSLARCAAGVAGQIHTTQAPDVGTARVVVVIRFRPS